MSHLALFIFETRSLGFVFPIRYRRPSEIFLFGAAKSPLLSNPTKTPVW